MTQLSRIKHLSSQNALLPHPLRRLIKRLLLPLHPLCKSLVFHGPTSWRISRLRGVEWDQWAARNTALLHTTLTLDISEEDQKNKYLNTRVRCFHLTPAICDPNTLTVDLTLTMDVTLTTNPTLTTDMPLIPEALIPEALISEAPTRGSTLLLPIPEKGLQIQNISYSPNVHLICNRSSSCSTCRSAWSSNKWSLLHIVPSVSEISARLNYMCTFL